MDMHPANQITPEAAQTAYMAEVDAMLDRPMNDRERKVALGYWRASSRIDTCAERIVRERKVVLWPIVFINSEGRTF